MEPQCGIDCSLNSARLNLMPLLLNEGYYHAHSPMMENKRGPSRLFNYYGQTLHMKNLNIQQT